jgi:hypothetical protein
MRERPERRFDLRETLVRSETCRWFSILPAKVHDSRLREHFLQAFSGSIVDDERVLGDDSVDRENVRLGQRVAHQNSFGACVAITGSAGRRI